MDIPLQPRDRDILVQVIEEQLDAAEDIERGMWRDQSIDDPDDLLAVITDHSERTKCLLELRERLRNAV